MKTKLLLITAIAYVLVGCDKEVSGPLSIMDTITFADKTVAETKSDIENTGVKMISELKSMNQDKGVQATVNLLDLADNVGNINENIKKSTYFKVLSAVRNLSSNEPDAKVMFKALQDTGSSSLLKEFDKVAGVYTYNQDSNDFIFAKDIKSDLIVFNFPASVTSRTAKNNDGKLTISKPKVMTGNFSALGESTTELPTEMKYDLSVSGYVTTSFSFTASYQADGIPTSIESKLTSGNFAFNVTSSYKETKITANYSFTHGSTTILDLGATLDGKFTKADIDKVEETVVVKDTFYSYYNYNWETGKYEDSTMNISTWNKSETYPERVLSNANAHFQFMDVKIVGQVDFTNLMKDLREADKSEYFSADSNVSFINKDISLIVVYASNNKAIANAEAYTKNEEYTYYEYIQKTDTIYLNYDYNGDEVIDSNDYYLNYTGSYNPTIKTRNVVDVRMIFADGSKSTMENYFEEGFNSLIDEFNLFITELNSTYKWEIDQMEKE